MTTLRGMTVGDQFRMPIIADRLARQQLYLDRPWEIYPIYLKPCRVKILIVTDSGGSFGTADFGLRELIQTITTPTVPWVRFDVVGANRRLDSTADIQDFRFDTHDLGQYDQMWLFGVERSGGLLLTDPELRSIAQFMDGGGGVFATGDHEDLGVAMCGRIPRVRNMRKWHWPGPGPNGEPVAPNVGGPDRYDTLSEGNDLGIQFNDQSDDIPQRISPKLYSTWSWSKWVHRYYPHPLLCGPHGVIRVLPDHPHEGECYEPSNLNDSFTFDGYTTDEYPAGLGPEVIAWSHTPGRLVDDNKGPLNPRTFGAIGAYDGHRVDRGRIVVDATWHHFFNINLIGELGNPDPIKGVGFDATATGAAVYDDIQAYFRNIAVWLARPTSHTCMWWRALWWLRWHHVLMMDLRPTYLEAMERLDLGELLRVGGEARDVLGRVASRCTVVRWIIDWLLQPRLIKIWQDLDVHIDPWRPVPPKPEQQPQSRDRETVPNLVLPLQGELVIDAALGAAVYAVATTFPEPTDDARGTAEEADWQQIVERHVERSLVEVTDHLAATAAQLTEMGGTLGRRQE